MDPRAEDSYSTWKRPTGRPMWEIYSEGLAARGLDDCFFFFFFLGGGVDVVEKGMGGMALMFKLFGLWLRCLGFVFPLGRCFFG